MKFLDLLRKLGIFRAGAEKAVYKNAVDRPMSLQSDDVFDSQKDVINLDKHKNGQASKGEPKEHGS